MQKPLVSIAVCTYNGEKFLVEQLDSLVSQTYPNLEIIITDDCSKDETFSKLQDYANRFDFIKIFKNEQNLGYVKNFEKAISLCNGDFIALCDQDDIWDKDKIIHQVEGIGDSLLCYHDSAFVDQNGKSLNKKLSDVVNMYDGSSFEPFLFFNCVSGHASLIKKELVNYALPFPKDLFHDRWLAYVATNLGSIKYLNLPLVDYRQHESSDTNILKLDRKEIKKELHGVPKIRKTLAELRVMINFKHNEDPDFLSKLYHLYEGRLNSYFCPSLVIMMYAHFRKLLYISKKGTFSKLNFVFKHIWGSKLKSA
jgi:glycosyltransferase involved in cell wall biosynthesis